MFLSRKCGKSFSQGKDQNRGLGSHEKGLQLNDERMEAIMVLKGFVDDNAWRAVHWPQLCAKLISAD